MGDTGAISLREMGLTLNSQELRPIALPETYGDLVG
jgi:hypothetical protein